MYEVYTVKYPINIFIKSVFPHFLQMELAPGVVLTKEQWQKIVTSKNLNPSRFTRNLAVSLWGSQILAERRVTGFACKRFKKYGTEAKAALTPVKVDAVQSEFNLKLAYFDCVWK